LQILVWIVQPIRMIDAHSCTLPSLSKRRISSWVAVKTSGFSILSAAKSLMSKNRR
jgi:hypothetical protein